MTFAEKYINPLTDFGFKKLFGSEYNKELLVDFLNQLLPEKHQIEELTYAKNEMLGRSIENRSAIFDLYCTSQNGDKFIVEIQKAKQNFFKDRSVYYASFPIQEQARKGEWNFQLNAVYTVGILDFVFNDHKKEEQYLHYIQLKDQDCNLFYDKLSYIYIELPKFQKGVEELETHFDKWLFVLKHLSKLQNRPTALQEKIFKQLFETAEIAQFSPDEHLMYHESLKHYWDLNNVIDTAAEEGLKKGMKKGMEKGIEKGLQKGLAEGKKTALLQTAKQSLKAGLSIEMITKITGLSQREVERLKDELD